MIVGVVGQKSWRRWQLLQWTQLPYFDKNGGLQSSLTKLPPHLCMNFFNIFFFQTHMTLTWMKIYVLDFLSTFTTHTFTCIDTLNLAIFLPIVLQCKWMHQNVLSASPMDPCLSPMHKTSNGDGNGVKMVSTHHIVYCNPQNHPPPPNWHIMLLQPCEACEASNDGGVNERKK